MDLFEELEVRLTAEDALRDLEGYVSSFGFRLSNAARRVFAYAESYAERVSVFPTDALFLISLLEASPRFSETVTALGGNPIEAIRILAPDAEDKFIGPYDFDLNPYSDTEHRRIGTRTRLVDLCLAISRRSRRREIFDIDIVDALFQTRSDQFPPEENEMWTDERLHTHFTTLSHIAGQYYQVLDVSFAQVREQLGISESTKSPVESAPAEIRASVMRLLQDHPDYDRNCFLIMSFASTHLHEIIAETVRSVMSKYEIDVLRADEQTYADDLLGNVQTHIYGCSIGIAVFERLESDVHNPNVAFEVGYLYGLRKPVCLLKERTLTQLHSDVVGKLYVEFDAQNIGDTLPGVLHKWLRDKKLI